MSSVVVSDEKADIVPPFLNKDGSFSIVRYTIILLISSLIENRTCYNIYRYNYIDLDILSFSFNINLIIEFLFYSLHYFLEKNYLFNKILIINCFKREQIKTNLNIRQ